MSSKYLYMNDNEIEIIETVRKHGSHNQKTHGGKGGGSDSGSAALEYPTKTSNPEMEYMLSDYVVEYPKEAGHKIINGTLRQQAGYDNVTPEFREDIQFRIGQMDKLVELSPPLSEQTKVFRGIGKPFAAELEAAGVGGSFTDKGFTSVSLDEQIAAGFPSVPTGNILEIMLPAGTKAVNPSKFFGRQKIVGNTDLRQEQELILGRGTTFDILEIIEQPYGIGKKFKVEARNG
jgi:hypothetical protein